MFETTEGRGRTRAEVVDAAKARRVRRTGWAVITTVGVLGACCAGGTVWAAMQSFGSC